MVFKPRILTEKPSPSSVYKSSPKKQVSKRGHPLFVSRNEVLSKKITRGFGRSRTRVPTNMNGFTLVFFNFRCVTQKFRWWHLSRSLYFPTNRYFCSYHDFLFRKPQKNMITNAEFWKGYLIGWLGTACLVNLSKGLIVDLKCPKSCFHKTFK